MENLGNTNNQVSSINEQVYESIKKGESLFAQVLNGERNLEDFSLIEYSNYFSYLGHESGIERVLRFMQVMMEDGQIPKYTDAPMKRSRLCTESLYRAKYIIIRYMRTVMYPNTSKRHKKGQGIMQRLRIWVKRFPQV